MEDLRAQLALANMGRVPIQNIQSAYNNWPNQG
jgi:hypothetical protein